jgi:formate dehydrogenase major subunit
MKRKALRVLKDALQQWPAVRQLTGSTVNDSATTPRTRDLHSRLRGTKAVESVCPYCAVGCGTLVHVRDNQVVDIEGNPASPINHGALCPKGADTFQYTVNPNRITRPLYRRPYGTEFEAVDLEWAMERIAERYRASRESNWADHDSENRPLRHTTGVAFLGGAALDNEENYLIKKLCIGTGVVAVENQARI